MARSRPFPAALLGAVVLAAALLVACGDGDATPQDFRDEDPPASDFAAGLYGGLRLGARAPEFAGLGPWLNTDPLTMAGLQQDGRVVLVDFWTYTCVNCIRTLPFLRDWDEKYEGLGLVIVGVHTPEFEFEKHPENVAKAVADEGIRYPVAQDDDYETWRAFNNNVWPAKYLFGADGHLLYRHFGEGDYQETEEAIRDALLAAGADSAAIEAIALGGIAEPEHEGGHGTTRELYFGYQRNYHPRGVYAGQEAYYDGPDRVADYVAGEERENGRWYAQGRWRNDREALVRAPSEDEGGEGYVSFRFLARTVNPVMHPPEGGTSTVIVEVDGRPLREDEAGPDVTWDADGRSMVLVDEPRMYRVLELPEYADGVITLRTDDEGFAIYAVTFGAYSEGP